jgi:hypothetical protein
VGSKWHETPWQTSTPSVNGARDDSGSLGAFGAISSATNKARKKTRELVDDHHCIVRPNMFIALRVRSAINFYKGRLPRYYSNRTILHLLTLGSTGAMIVMGGAGLSLYVPIVTVVASSLTAWGEFHAFPKKLARYSSIINELTGLLLWWEHLTEVERNTVRSSSATIRRRYADPARLLCCFMEQTQKFQDLVHHVEAALATERKGWLTTSQAAKMLAKQLSSDGDADDDGRRTAKVP